MRSFADLASLASVIFITAWMMQCMAAGKLKETLKVLTSNQK
jgi:hypothetical protein